MKTITTILLIAWMVFFNSCIQNNSNEKSNTSPSPEFRSLPTVDSLLQVVTELYDTGEYSKALEGVNVGIKDFGRTDELIDTKYRILLALEDYEQGLKVFDEIIDRKGDSPDIIIDKIRLLRKLDREEEALAVALQIDRKYGNDSPYMSLIIADIYMAKEVNDSALHWLIMAHNKGFNEFDYLLTDKFESLHDEEAFQSMINEMKIDAGIGSPAMDFTITQFSGETYQLAEDEGKVILLDFWATWCPPCVAEFPNLKNLYEQFKEKGFQIVSISADSKRESVENFLSRNQADWIIGFSGNGREDEVILRYEITSYPTYIFIDRDGKINHITSSGGENLTNTLASLLK